MNLSSLTGSRSPTPRVCLADQPGAVFAGPPPPAPPAGGPAGSVRLGETMHLLLPAPAAGRHDSEPGPDCLDHEGHEFLTGESSRNSNRRRGFSGLTQHLKRSKTAGGPLGFPRCD